MIICPICEKEISNLRNHKKDNHAASHEIKVGGQSFQVKRVELKDRLQCPLCSKKVQSCTDLRRHLINTHKLENEEGEDEDNKDGDEMEENGEDEKDLDIAVLSTFTRYSQSNSKKRDRPENIIKYEKLKAVDALAQDIDSQCVALSLLNTLKLHPANVTDHEGSPQVILATLSTINQLTKRSLSSAVVTTTIENKSKKHHSLYSPNIVYGLASLLSWSPLSRVLTPRKFEELNDDLCEILNTEWTFRPNLCFACSRLLAGSIMLNTLNGEAVLLNTVEPVGCRYSNIWPTSINFPEGLRLMIGTKTCNLLVTSSTRLDDRGNQKASLGGITLSFKLLTDNSSSATRIFLDKESVGKALNLASDDKAYTVDTQDRLGSLRQLRSKFDMEDTYVTSRASGPLTQLRAIQPLTVFTLSWSNKFRDYGRTASVVRIFNEIAKEVLKNKEKGCLNKRYVEDALAKYDNDIKEEMDVKPPVSTNKIYAALLDILCLYKDNSSTLVVIGNKELNSPLETLADHLSSNISEANTYSEAYLMQSFEL
ncbi:hypothetical protein BGZ46_008501 [Entomortierella lignicola]|nr:hypothetical protein BGZ46_008501 [Entomortierella lignicola]